MNFNTENKKRNMRRKISGLLILMALGMAFTGLGTSFNCVSGDCRGPVSNFESGDEVVVESNISFDNEENIVQNGQSQDDLQQWPSACGDDMNEYLIREHASSSLYGDEFNPDLTRDNIYVCADRPTDCAYNGKVYSEGQLKNVSTVSDSEERGDPVNDPEVCLDLDPSKPGGEWYDLDNEFLASDLVGSIIDTQQWNNLSDFSDPRYWGTNPGTDVNLNQLGYFNHSGLQQNSTGSRAPTGYATEDDCQSERNPMEVCDDRGQYERPRDGSLTSWFNAGNFTFRSGNPDMQEGAEQDNYDTGQGIVGVHNKMQDSSDQFEPGATTQPNWPDILGSGYEVTDLEDSTPGPDNWSLTRDLQVSVSNDGSAYPSGQCYYRDGATKRTNLTDTFQTKYDKIFGNSYAYERDWDGDGVVEGVWEDPDDLATGGHTPDVDTADFSCDLTGPDKGYGWNTESGNADDWYYKNTGSKSFSDSKVVVGDIAFAVNEGKPGGFEQEPNVCGDDNKEYLLEELGESANSEHHEGRWACGTTTTDCVTRTDTGNALYRHWDYVNTKEKGEDYGRYKKDKEVCYMQSYDDYGTWYDQDFSQQFCRENTLYGKEGVRWIDTNYINKHPYSVLGGIDDDANQLEVNRGNATITSTQGTVTANYDQPDTTPVPTGVDVSAVSYRDSVVSKGFCGGDDGSEYLVTQDCVTSLCESNNSVKGVAGRPDACVLDGDHYPEVSDDKRRLYSPGDQVEFDLGSSTATVSCFDGSWYEKWPIVFRKDQVDVPLGTTRLAQFKVINVESEQKTINIELDDENQDPWNNAWSYFSQSDSRSDDFQVDVDARSSKTYTLELYGGNLNVDNAELNVSAESADGTLSGWDTINVNVTQEPGVSQAGTESSNDVPGIGLVQMMVLALISSMIYLVRGRP